MSMLPQPPNWLLQADPVTVSRPATTTDVEGDPVGATPVTFNDRGTLMRSSAYEQLLALQRGTNVDKALGVRLGTQIFEGDEITVYGVVYEVVTAEDRRLYRRLLMRKR